MADVIAPMLTKEDYRLLPDSGPRYRSSKESSACHRPRTVTTRSFEKYRVHAAEIPGSAPAWGAFHAPFNVYLSEHDVFRPDVVLVKKENFGVLTDAGVEGTPDFVVEILSPSNAYLDKKPKLRVYARTGVRELWLVDPGTRVVHVYHLQADAQKPAATYTEGDAFSLPTSPGLAICVIEIFKR